MWRGDYDCLVRAEPSQILGSGPGKFRFSEILSAEIAGLLKTWHDGWKSESAGRTR